MATADNVKLLEAVMTLTHGATFAIETIDDILLAGEAAHTEIPVETWNRALVDIKMILECQRDTITKFTEHALETEDVLDMVKQKYMS